MPSAKFTKGVNLDTMVLLTGHSGSLATRQVITRKR
jgi:hypothetical protein